MNKKQKIVLSLIVKTGGFKGHKKGDDDEQEPLCFVSVVPKLPTKGSESMYRLPEGGREEGERE